MQDLEVPVLIVGGGGCGLSSSIFLSDLGVDHLLVERHTTTSHLPKAHYLNQRSMEVFRQHHLADDIYAVGTPMEHLGNVGWMTSLGGDRPLDRQWITRMDSFGGGALREQYLADSPVTACNYPQIRLEPLLKGEAEKRAPRKLLFNHEMVTFTQDADGVSAQVRDRADGSVGSVRTKYLIAADGGKSIGQMLDVTMDGPTGLLDMVSVHFTADLSEFYDSSCVMIWLVNPEGAGSWGSGVLVQMGPTWGKSEEWVVHFTVRPDDPGRWDDSAAISRIRDLLKIPGLELQVHKVSHWILEGVLASRYGVGRVFLAGDAAHRHPPTNGLGMNSAFQDAHNLAWKLSAVLREEAAPSILESYEVERRPVGMRNVDWAMFTFLNHMVLDAGLGLRPGMSVAEQEAEFTAFFSDTPMGETRRARAAEVFSTQRTEFQAHDLEIGYRYDEGALVHDGTEPPPRDPMGNIHYPTTRPGHRLPHAWLEVAGKQISTLDLVGRAGQFLLITGPDGEAWCDVAGKVAENFGISLRAVRIGAECEFADCTGRWNVVRQIDDDGAIIIRPDNHVGWRSKTIAADISSELEHAFTAILGRGSRSIPATTR